MKLTSLANVIFSLIVSLSGLPSHAADATAKKPNIGFILADDLGFEALGCYGGASYKRLGPVRTPNLEFWVLIAKKAEPDSLTNSPHPPATSR